MITEVVLIPEELVETCKELSQQYKPELIESRQEERKTTFGRNSMKSELYRRAIRYYAEAVKKAGKLI